ncbi:hypothetical protein Dsin_001146 [Dipteronia sinensis]|uniref:Reverse transcriptase n=1 Tax=Dipteronia sinensis TaxID=43782 RepID=A0AAE0B4R7_9ROSI|nr:hypothetical protein Dsin_001146 [Dipteronia sinensis]
MAGVIRIFFNSLFKSSNPSAQIIRKATVCVRSHLSEVQKDDLSSVFLTEEGKDAVFSLSPTKAPGLDDFQAIFFQKIWRIVGEEVSRLCLSILNGEGSIKHFNNTNVVLIPKVNNPTNLRDFRPISIYSVIYKVVTKAIAAGLKTSLPDIIYSFQSAFVPKAFSCLVSNFERGGRILGTRCARGGPLISHILFTDGNILFCKASSASGSRIRNILGIYERASGQQINL